MANTPYLDYSNPLKALKKQTAKSTNPVKTGIDITGKNLTKNSYQHDVTTSVSEEISALGKELDGSITSEFAPSSSEQKYLDFVKVLGDNEKIDKEIADLKDEIDAIKGEKYDYTKDPKYKELLESAYKYRKDYKNAYDGMYAYEDPNRSSSTAITNSISTERSLSESIEDYIKSLKEQNEADKQKRIDALKERIQSLRKGYKTAHLRSDLKDIKINADDKTIYDVYFD